MIGAILGLFKSRKTIITIIVVAVVGLFFWGAKQAYEKAIVYEERLGKATEQLEAQSEQYSKLIKQREDAIKQLKENIERLNEISANINEMTEENKRELSKLREELNNFDFEREATENPDETEVFITRQLITRLECIEAVSGNGNAKCLEESSEQD